MKLFTPGQAKEEFKVKQGNDVVQIAYLDDTLKRLQLQINAANHNFDLSLAEQRKVYGEEKDRLQGEVRQLEANLVLLRAERKHMMIPIDQLLTNAQELNAKANERVRLLDSRENELHDKIELVTAKIDELTDRETDIEHEELYLEGRREGIEAEATQVSIGHQKLNSMLDSFNTQVSAKSHKLAEREALLAHKEKNNREYLNEWTQKLNDRERALNDRQSALEREFNRLKINK